MESEIKPNGFYLPFTVHYLSTLKGEGVRSVGLSLHLVQLGEDCVGEIIIGLKVELQDEALFKEEGCTLALHLLKMLR